MNVDEAMKVAKHESLGWFDDMHEAGPVLAAEVERLRKEVAKLQAQLDVAAAAAMVELKHMLDNTAKAQQKKG